MIRGRERYKSAKKGGIKLNINLKKIFLFLLLLSFVGYLVYVYIGFVNVKSVNPLKEGNATHYLLSRYPSSFKKTLIVLENKYNEQDRIEKVFLYAENKEKDVAVMIYLPNWVLYTGLESDFGNAVAISGFRYAGDFKQPGKGIEFAIWQFEELFGMKVDEYIWLDSDAYLLLQENLGEFSSDTVYAQYYQNGWEVSEEVFFFNGFVSRLSWLNLIFSANSFRDREAVIYSSLESLPGVVVELKNIHSRLLKLRPYVIDLSSSKYLDRKEFDGVGGMQNYLKLSAFDTVWRENTEKMIERELERERVRVEVYNASGIAGKASSYARKVANSGCDVVRFDNAPSRVENTKFYVPNPQDFKRSLEIITELFPGQYEIVNGRPDFMTTGDIVIILGEDISGIYSF